MSFLVSGSRKIPDNHPVLSVRALLFFYCFFMLFFAGSLSPLSTFGFSPNGLSLNFCQDFLGFLCIFFQKDDIPIKTQQPTPWNFCCLMRGGLALFIMR